jgi:thymidylate synthase
MNLLASILHLGDRTAPRGKPIIELMGMTIHLEDITKNIIVHPERNLNYRFMIAEWIWIALGRKDLKALTKYNSKMSEFSDDGVTLAGAYGPRLFPQWPGVLTRLVRDHRTRQAVAVIYRPGDALVESKDIPCTLSLQFLLRDQKLNCIATMRSSDAWLGIPYDVFSFSMLTAGLAGELGVLPGWLKINIGSSHLYEEHEQQARKVLSYPEFIDTIASPWIPHMPREWKHDWFDDPHSQFDEFGPPWSTYHKVLHCKTSEEAKYILRRAGGENVAANFR